MRAIIIITFREALAKKFILSIFIIISLFLLLFLGFLNLDTTEAINAIMEATGQDSFRAAIVSFETSLISHVPFFVVFVLFIILTSSFVPAMLEKGSIELLISKPISRMNIVLGKFVAVNFFILAILVYLVGIMWIMISFKSGVWHFPFLYSILWFTLVFAVLYSAIILIGLLTQSSILSILINLILLFPVTGILGNREAVFSFVKSDITKFIINFFYYVLPKPWDIREICINTIEGTAVESWEPVITSIIFCAAVMAYSVYYFSKKDY
jgi:ABC-type transport system involved in multi-copper enzyme maturation permease subunit